MYRRECSHDGRTTHIFSVMRHNGKPNSRQKRERRKPIEKAVNKQKLKLWN